MADIVVYGGTFAGVAAAAKAAANAPSKAVALIVPDTSNMLGGIGTAGGQNFMDVRAEAAWPRQQKGTFNWWYNSVGHYYNPATLSNLMKADLAKYKNITYYYGYDITSFTYSTSPYRITSVTLKTIYRAATGYVVWGTLTQKITGTVFIDASDDGRLARLANFGGTVGRYDWPADRLDAEERGLSGRARQQAATLMIKIRGVNPVITGDSNYKTITLANSVVKGSVTGGYGGVATYKNNANIVNFNNKYGSQGYAIKPFNIAQAGPNSQDYWINTLLVFNVDGRANERDVGTTNYPTNMRTDYKNVDRAWVDARNFIRNTSAFLTALKSFPSLSNAAIVTDVYGNPVVGEMLYIRETIHMAGTSQKANGTENTNYALTANEAHKAGNSPYIGGDVSNYATRIGLNFYWTDINAYKFADMRDASNKYIWGHEIALKLRPDISAKTDPITASSPINPVYVPYNILTSQYVANLLIPGYATGASSFAWSEVRVIPNLTVLGDAAGIAAAYAVTNNKSPLYFVQSDITKIQASLAAAGAKLEK